MPTPLGMSPGFPVELGGVGELHAAFLTESRTRSHGVEPRTGNPGRLGVHGPKDGISPFNRSNSRANGIGPSESLVGVL